MQVNYISIGQRIRGKRLERGLSQAELSELIDRSPTYMSYIENGSKSMSLETFINIVNALRVSSDYLLRDSIETANTVTSSTELDSILNGCSPYEKRVILDTAAAMKSILRSNRKGV